MIEKTVLDYLNNKLSVPVYPEIPASPPDEFVIIEKTGSSRENRIDTATMAFQSYGASMLAAARLNETVKAAVEGMIELDSISAVYLNSDYNFTDQSTKHYRYQALYVITYL